MADKMEKRGVYLYIDDKSIRNDIKSVESEMRTLVTAQKKMVIGSEEYVRSSQKIRMLKGIIAEHNQQLKATSSQLDENKAKMKANSDEASSSSSRLGKMAEGFNRYFGMVTAFIAGITGVFLTMKSAVQDYLDLDSSYSDVMKYTGMTRDQVVDLNDSFKKMDTKTARIELNALASDAGKLGIEGKQNLLDFAEAGDIIRVSLGEDLGKDAIVSIGKLAQMFGDADKMGIRQAMLATGSAINDIGQTSSASEPYLVEFTNRMAGTGKQADIAIPKLLGYASVLDQNAQQVEMSATALSGVMMKMFQDPAKFAKIAGIEVGKFTKLIKTDANEAVLQFLTSLGKRGGMSELAPIFDEMKLDGARASQVLAVLAGNVDLVREQQEQANNAFIKGTSVVSEFNTKNNDLTAQMMKAKKIFQERVYDLGEKLLPLSTKLVTSTSALVKGLNILTTFIMSNARSLITITAVIGTYILAVKAQELWDKRAIAVKILTTTWTEIAKRALLAKLIVLDLYKKRVSLAVASQEMFNLVLKMNPIGMVAALVLGAAAAFVCFTRKVNVGIQVQKDFNDIQKTVDEGMASHKSTVDLLIDTIHNENLANEDRLKAIKALQEIIPNYNANISKEGKIVDENTGAIKRYMAVLEAQLKMESSRDKLKELYKKQFEQEDKTDQYKSDIKSLKKEYSNSNNNSPDIGGYQAMGRASNISATQAALEKEQSSLKDTNTRIEKIKAYYQMSMKNLSDINKINPKVLNNEKVVSSNNKNNIDKDKKKKDIFAPVELEYAKKKEQLSKDYLSGSIKSQEEYNRLSEELEFNLLHDKLKIAGVEPAQREQIQQQILDSKIKIMNELTKLDDSSYMTQQNKDQRELDAIKDKYSAMQQIILQAYDMGIIPTIQEKDKYIANLNKKQADDERKVKEKQADDIVQLKDKALSTEIYNLVEKRMSQNMTEKQYNDELKAITIRSLEEKLKIVGLSEDQIQAIKKESQDIQLQQFQESQSHELDKQREYSQLIENVMVTFAEDTAELFSNNEATLKDYLKKVVILMLDSLEKVLEIKMAEAAIVSAAGGPVGWASLAFKIAAMKAAFGAVKAVVGNFYDGGYTPGGAWDKPQGIVHSNEFVSNRFAVSNPHLRPVFDLIDYAQRTNSVANLTADDVAAVVNQSSPNRPRVPGTPTQQGGSSVDVSMLIPFISECTKTMEAVKQRFAHPIVAETYATGRRGTIESEDFVRKMQSNVSRKSI